MLRLPHDGHHPPGLSSSIVPRAAEGSDGDGRPLQREDGASPHVLARLLGDGQPVQRVDMSPSSCSSSPETTSGPATRPTWSACGYRQGYRGHSPPRRRWRRTPRPRLRAPDLRCLGSVRLPSIPASGLRLSAVLMAEDLGDSARQRWRAWHGRAAEIEKLWNGMRVLARDDGRRACPARLACPTNSTASGSHTRRLGPQPFQERIRDALAAICRYNFATRTACSTRATAARLGVSPPTAPCNSRFRGRVSMHHRLHAHRLRNGGRVWPSSGASRTGGGRDGSGTMSSAATTTGHVLGPTPGSHGLSR